MLCGGPVLLRLLSVAGLFFSLDQFTKMLVARRLAEGQSVACRLLDQDSAGKPMPAACSCITPV